MVLQYVFPCRISNLTNYICRLMLLALQPKKKGKEEEEKEDLGTCGKPYFMELIHENLLEPVHIS